MKEFQRIWDEELISSWEQIGKTISIVYRFTERASPILSKLKDPRRMVGWIATLDLNRCPWKMLPGNNTNFHPWNMRTRAYIHCHCPELTSALYNEKLQNSDIVDAIDNYAWYTAAIVDRKRSQECGKASYYKRTIKRIYMRDLCKKHDWRTVK